MSKSSSTRRDFLKTTGTATSLAMSAPMIVPQSVVGANPPSDKVVVGHIGLGWRGMQLMNSTMRADNIHVGAVCDLDLPFVNHAQRVLDDQLGFEREFIEGSGSNMKRPEQPEGAADAYTDYRYMLERSDLDAVVIAVPDHWHAKTYIDAMDAGKDVYGEKPLSLTIAQGRAIAKKARETSRVFQTGSQQRSADEFYQACSYARAGRIGKISNVDVGVGGAPQTEGGPNAPIPAGFDYDMWLGPAPYVDYNPGRSHVQFRWFFDYSGGMVTDWGAHHLDITQWGLGMDHTGPKYVEGSAETRPGFYTTFTSFDFTFTYANGIKVRFGNQVKGGVTFHGEKGTIWCNRGGKESSIEGLFDEPLGNENPNLYQSRNHIQDWIQCIKDRTDPICHAEVGHRSCTVCHIGNICGWVGGRKLEWDPVHEVFVNDPEANQHLDREPRAPWSYL